MTVLTIPSVVSGQTKGYVNTYYTNRSTALSAAIAKWESLAKLDNGMHQAYLSNIGEKDNRFFFQDADPIIPEYDIVEYSFYYEKYDDLDTALYSGMLIVSLIYGEIGLLAYAPTYVPTTNTGGSTGGSSGSGSSGSGSGSGGFRKCLVDIGGGITRPMAC